MSLKKDETRACGYIRSEFTSWALWRTLMRTECFLFVHHTTSILAKLSIWCFEHSDDISCSLLINQRHSDESWEERNACLWIYIYIFVIYMDIYIYNLYIWISYGVFDWVKSQGNTLYVIIKKFPWFCWIMETNFLQKCWNESTLQINFYQK